MGSPEGFGVFENKSDFRKKLSDTSKNGRKNVRL
jgi:hypothetical protein